jgi:hypothetical protein
VLQQLYCMCEERGRAVARQTPLKAYKVGTLTDVVLCAPFIHPTRSVHASMGILVKSRVARSDSLLLKS